MEHTEAFCYQATTEYGEEACRALAYLMIRRLRKWPRWMLVITGIITVIGSAAIMLLNGQVSAVGLIFLLLGNVMCMFGLLAERFCVRMLMASHRKNGIPQNTYLFFQQKLRIQNEAAHRDYAYGDFSRVLEMSGYLFLFMADGQMYLLKLKDVKGNLKAFRAFLEEKLTQSRNAKG